MLLLGCQPDTQGIGELATESEAETHNETETQSTAASTGDGATATSGAETSTTVADASSDDGSTTSALDDELPPEAAGQWLCTGWDDPIFLRIEMDDTGSWSGTACAPDPMPSDPPSWTNCGELLEFGVFGTPADWVVELPYDDAGGPIGLHLALGYQPAPDERLEGGSGDDGLDPTVCLRP